MTKKEKFNITEKSTSQHIYTVARLNFKKVYDKLKKVTKDIDRISTKAHFHIYCKLEDQEK